MKKTIALMVSIVFSLGIAGFAVAQTPAPKPADAPKAEQKTEKVEKKAKETKADCLKVAKDDAAKAECEKKFAKAKKDAAATAKKDEAKKP
jgi:hypothetical protein